MASGFVYGDGVEVIGKRLRGQKGAVSKVSSENEVQIQLADGKVETLKAQELRAMDFHPVDCVEAFGLTSESGRSLNGKIGIVTRFVPESGRFEVSFPQSKVNLRPENLRKPTPKTLSPAALQALKAAEVAKAAAAKAWEEATAARSAAPSRRMRAKGLPDEVAAAAAEALVKAEEGRLAEEAAEAARKAGEEAAEASTPVAGAGAAAQSKVKKGGRPPKAKAEQADEADQADQAKAKRGRPAKAKAQEAEQANDAKQAPAAAPAPTAATEASPEKADEDGTPNKLPAKRRRQAAPAAKEAEGKTPAAKRTRGAKAEDSVLAEAEAKGIRGLLENLAARPAVAEKGFPMAKLLAALTAADGLVNKAKDALLA